MKRCAQRIGVCLVVVLGVVSCSGSKNATSPPAPTSATFVVADSGNSNVRTLVLARNVDGTSYSQNCSIPPGATISVPVTLPASDSYNIQVWSSGAQYICGWNAVSITLGGTYYVTLRQGGNNAFR